MRARVTSTYSASTAATIRVTMRPPPSPTSRSPLPDGVDRPDAAPGEHDPELLPLDGLAGEAALVVGDDLVHLAGPDRAEHGVPLWPLDRGVGGGDVVVDEHPDVWVAPASVGHLDAVHALALAPISRRAGSLLMRQ
jgi:hypothetical protein